MNDHKLFQIVSRIFDIPIEKINYNSSPKSIPSWNSFTGYILLDEIENEFSIKISLDEAMEISNLEDYKKILQNKGVKFI